MLVGCRSDEALDRSPAAGPALVSPRLIPVEVKGPDIVEPELAPPEIAHPRTAPPRLVRPPMIDPAVTDPHQVDEFHQKVVAADVLWIVDNSGSMANERRGLARAFGHFIRELTERRIDFHLGVTSTTVGPEGLSGRLREVGGVRFITPEHRDPEALFARMVDFPPGRERREQGLEAMRLALGEPLTSGYNRGFLREGTVLTVVVVSDEDDGSFGYPGHFVRFLIHTRRPGNEGLVTFNAIVGLTPDGCTPAGEEGIFGAAAEPAERYLEVVRQTGGVAGSICDEDFGPILSTLGRRTSNLDRTFPLSSPPVEDTLRVWVDGEQVPREGRDGLLWEYRAELRAVVFTDLGVPGSGAVIRMAYVVRVEP